MPTSQTNTSCSVDILLSTYNGMAFLGAQIESLFKQSHKEWRLLVRDDGSTDETLKKIEMYAEANPGKIEIIKDSKGSLGPMLSFSVLLEHSNAEYSFFCDQDDVWNDNKIELTLEKMRKMETQLGAVPVLVHTDLSVVDSNLVELSGSFWEFQNLSPNITSLKDLLLLNNVTGCTLMLNAALRDFATPVPPEAVMHDWWIALVASAFGYIGFVNSSTIKYRQHSGNVAGSTSYSAGYFFSRLGSLGATARLLSRIVGQAKIFLATYRIKFVPMDLRHVTAFGSLLSLSRLTRIGVVMKYGFRTTGFLRTLGIYALLFFMPREDQYEERTGGADE